MSDAQTIEEAVARHLRTVIAVSAICGARSFEDLLPENKDIPALTVESNGFSDWGTLDEVPTDGVSQVVVDCMAKEAAEASALRAAVVAELNGYSGRMIGIDVQHIRLTNLLSDSPRPDWLKDKAFCKRAIFEITHSL